MKNLILFTLFITTISAIPFSFHKHKESYENKYNDTFYCAMCEFLINHGEEYITKNTTHDDATHFLDHLCERLPKSKHAICDLFIQENYNHLINFIIEKESPHSVCKQLHFCSTYDQAISQCDFCKYATHRIERFLSYNNTVTDIVDFGNMFCDTYRANYRNVCESIVPVYYSTIIGKIIDQYNFVEVCSNIGICI